MNNIILNNISTKFNFRDYILLFIIFIAPYLDVGLWWTITAFIPGLSSMGSSLLCFVLALILFISSINYKHVKISSQFKFLIILASLYSIIIFINSTIHYGFWNSLTVYRIRFIQIVTFCLTMNYIESLSINKLETYFNIMLKCLVIMSLIYFIQCSGINILGSEIRTESAGGIEMIRNVIGMPQIIPVLFTFIFSSYLYKKNRRFKILTILSILVCAISFTRSIMASAIIIILCSTIFHSIKYGLSGKFQIIIYGIIGCIIVFIFFPNFFNYWTNLIDSTINSQLVNKEGTYAFRQNLIETAYTSLNENNNLLTGYGYLRDAEKGEYSFVLGTDTYIAPVIWCEGVIGLSLRCLPYLYLLILSTYKFFKAKTKYSSLCLMIISVSIISTIPNYVQTSIFMKYNMNMGILYLLYVLYVKQKIYA